MAKKSHTGLTQRIRERAQKLGRFTESDVEGPDETPRQVKSVICELLKTGEFRKIKPGLYEYAGKTKIRSQLDVIWHLIRSHRQFSTDDIERLSGAKRTTALEYLNCLKKLGYIRQPRRGFWQLVSDPGPETPVNTSKCQRLRRRRAEGRGLRTED